MIGSHDDTRVRVLCLGGRPWFSTLTLDRRLPYLPGMDRRRFLLSSLAGALTAPRIADGFVEYARACGLLAFGVSFPDLWRRAAGLVDKIFRGARPADLPVERATQFDLALGLTIPPSLLLRAEQIIE